MSKINYQHLPTERINPHTAKLDQMSIEQGLELMHTEDSTIAEAVHKTRKEMAKGVRILVKSLQQDGRLFFCGAGTSGRFGILEAAECPPTFGTRPEMVQALMAGGKQAVFLSKEGAEDSKQDAIDQLKPKLRQNDVVIAIAASGITPFVTACIEVAQAKGAKSILVSCNPKSPLRKKVHCAIAADVGPEIIAGSTRLKAGTATKLILNRLTVLSMVQLGKVFQNRMVDLQAKSHKLKERALSLIEQLGEIPRAEAEIYFRRAKKNVKTAILMARTQCTFKEAEKRLLKAKGFLGKALDL